MEQTPVSLPAKAGDEVASAMAAGIPAFEPMKKSLPHPEEPCAARRLEGWQRVCAVHPSFETPI
jgi:hypothetical protein